jgi:small conductance mechanosensitive channel
MADIQGFLTKVNEQAVLYAPKVIAALVTLLIGWWIIKILVAFLKRRMKKSKVDESLMHFLGSLIGIALKVMLLISVISMLGVQMTSFIAVLGAAGLAVGLALQGSLGNFAGGVLILLFKPFKVGDVIDAQGFLGKVDKIQVFNTTLKTPDNKTVIIPNGSLSNGSITNLSTEPTRRVDFVFGIGYDDNFEDAKKVLNEVIKKDKRILKDPAPFVKIGELGDSSVNFTVRVWAKGEDYWDVYFDMYEFVKKEFDKNKISIPYPQRDVHLIK